jgi:hypothetical protein
MAAMRKRMWIWLIVIIDILSLAYLATLGFGWFTTKCAMITAPPFLFLLELRLEMNRSRINRMDAGNSTSI